MAIGVRIRDSRNIQFDSIVMRGMDTAFEIYDSDDIRMTSVRLESTRTAISGERVRGLVVKDMLHSEAGWHPKPTLLAYAVWRVAHGYV